MAIFSTLRRGGAGLAGVALCAALSGCLGLGEAQMHALASDWQRVEAGDIFPQRMKDMPPPWPTAAQAEKEADKAICLHPNGENRFVVQDGVSDHVAYRRCALAPYPETQGQRLNNRPDDLAPVAVVRGVTS